MKKFFKKIKFFIEYIGFIIIFKFLSLLGLERSAKLASYVARFLGPLLSVSRVAEKNLKMVFGEELNKKEVIKDIWDNFGRFIGEFPFITRLSKSELEQRIKVTGLEHLAKFQSQNQPFLLFTAHLANWEIALKIIERLYPKFGIVYRKANNPYINTIITASRARENILLIAKGPTGGKDLFKAIKSGFSIAMLVDQKMNEGISVPFFGRPAMTSNAIAKLALQFNYPIIPAQIIRTQGSNFEIIIHPPLSAKRTSNEREDIYNIMLQINQILEGWIRQHKEQWLWFHNRWKF